MDIPPNTPKPSSRTWNKFIHMFLADMVGNAAEIGFLKYQNKIDEKLPFLKATFKSAFYVPMKILQTPIEWTLNTFAGSIEGEHNREERKKKTDDERLDGLLDTTYHYASAIAVGWGTLVAAEKAMSRVTKTPSLPNSVWMKVDLPVHAGTAFLLGSSFMKPVTGSVKDVTKKIMLASGWTEEKAEQDSRFAMAYILPNYLTLIPTVGMMSSLYKAEAKGIIKDMGHKDLMGQPEHHFVSNMAGKVRHDEFSGLTNAMLKVAQKVGVITTEAAHSVAH